MIGHASCKHVKGDGASCRAAAMEGSPYCWFHNPLVKEQRDEARKRGARQTRQRRLKVVLPADTTDLPLFSADDVVMALADTFNRVRRGELDVRVGNCLGMLAGTLLRAFQGEKAIVMTVQPEPAPIASLVSEDRKRQILNVVRTKHGLAPLPAIGWSEPAPVTAPEVNGERRGDQA